MQTGKHAIVELTPREHEVMVLALEGFTNRDIATRLGISHRTVETHKARVLGKMGVESVIDLMRSVDEKLRLDAQELDDLYQNSPCGYLSLSPAGDILRINDTLLGWLGHARAEIVNRTDLATLIAPAEAATFRACFEECRRSGRRCEFRGEMLRRDGTAFPVAIYTTAVHDGDGQFRMFRSMVADLTNEAIAQRQHRELRTWQELYRTVVEDQTELICRFLADGTILFVNGRYAAFFGLDQQRSIGKKWQPAAHPDDVAYIESQLKTLSPANPVVVIENRVYAASGEVRWMQFVNRAFYDGDVLREIQSVGRDITDRKLREQALERTNAELEEKVEFGAKAVSMANQAAAEADRLKLRFLANINHEIRTPMNGILGMGRMARRLATDPKQIDQLDKLEGLGRELMTIIEGILELSRSEAEQFPLKSNRFLLGDIMDRVCRRLRGFATSKDIALAAALDDDLRQRPLVGDSEILEQVIYTLTENAIKFTRDGSITIRATSTPLVDEVTLLGIDVIDTGLGISAQDQERMFQPFAKADQPAGRQLPGSGVGLALCKRLVKALGGDIGVDSTPGSGSRFWVRVQFGRGEATGTKPAAALAERAAPP